MKIGPVCCMFETVSVKISFRLLSFGICRCLSVVMVGSYLLVANLSRKNQQWRNVYLCFSFH